MTSSDTAPADDIVFMADIEADAAIYVMLALDEVGRVAQSLDGGLYVRRADRALAADLLAAYRAAVVQTEGIS
jgi:hypothetical protein